MSLSVDVALAVVGPLLFILVMIWIGKRSLLK